MFFDGGAAAHTTGMRRLWWTKTGASVAERLAALEAELAEVKARLDEPLNLLQERKVRQMFGARACKRMEAVEPLTIKQPTFFLGWGQILVGKRVRFGIARSPYFFAGYIYVELRNKQSLIRFGDDVYVSNNCVICAEGEGIDIGDRTMIGANVEIVDTDGHDLAADRRIGGTPKTGQVSIGKNVLIGGNVKILKGVVIGDNAVIGNGSVVTSSIPENMIAAGNPAKPIKPIPQ